jgi:hypothetical protein
MMMMMMMDGGLVSNSTQFVALIGRHHVQSERFPICILFYTVACVSLGRSLRPMRVFGTKLASRTENMEQWTQQFVSIASPPLQPPPKWLRLQSFYGTNNHHGCYHSLCRQNVWVLLGRHGHGDMDALVLAGRLD